MIAKREWIVEAVPPKLPPYVAMDGFDTAPDAQWFADNVLKPQGGKTKFRVKEAKARKK